MERMKNALILLSVIYLVAVSMGITYCQNHEYKLGPYVIEDLRYPDYSFKKDGWVLNQYWIDKGVHGILWRNDEEVPDIKGERLSTPLGMMIYFGSVEEKQGLTGWGLLKNHPLAENFPPPSLE